MRDAAKLSVCIVACNEAERIGRTLKAASQVADQIVVIDSGSTDGTQEIAQGHGAQVIHVPWKGHAWAKATGNDYCDNDWVLMLDADECLSDGLIAAISRAKLEGWHGCAAFTMRWRLCFPGEDRASFLRNQAKLIRLWNKQHVELSKIVDSNDDRPRVLSGQVGHLSGYVLHQTMISFAHMEQKYVQLTDEQARHNAARGKNYSRTRLFFEHPVKLFKYLVLRKHALYGFNGWVLSWMAAHRNFMKIAKTIQENNKQEPKL